MKRSVRTVLGVGVGLVAISVLWPSPASACSDLSSTNCDVIVPGADIVPKADIGRTIRMAEKTIGGIGGGDVSVPTLGGIVAPPPPPPPVREVIEYVIGLGGGEVSVPTLGGIVAPPPPPPPVREALDRVLGLLGVGRSSEVAK